MTHDPKNQPTETTSGNPLVYIPTKLDGPSEYTLEDGDPIENQPTTDEELIEIINHPHHCYNDIAKLAASRLKELSEENERLRYPLKTVLDETLDKISIDCALRSELTTANERIQKAIEILNWLDCECDSKDSCALCDALAILKGEEE